MDLRHLHISQGSSSSPCDSHGSPWRSGLSKSLYQGHPAGEERWNGDGVSEWRRKSRGKGSDGEGRGGSE